MLSLRTQKRTALLDGFWRIITRLITGERWAPRLPAGGRVLHFGISKPRSVQHATSPGYFCGPNAGTLRTVIPAP